MLRRLYNWVMRLSASPQAEFWLASLAFAEGVFFPVPPDVMLMPIVLARRERAWRYAAICTVASVLGGCVGYSVGYFLRPVGDWLLALTSSASAEEFRHIYQRWGALLLAIPIPYKITAIASGALRLPFLTFLGVSLVVRSLRFFIVAALVKRYGEPIRSFVEQRLALVLSAVVLALVGLIVALKLLLQYI
jgi:membrane protein YqaA with SNARE-associated domain